MGLEYDTRAHTFHISYIAAIREAHGTLMAIMPMRHTGCMKISDIITLEFHQLSTCAAAIALELLATSLAIITACNAMANLNAV